MTTTAPTAPPPTLPPSAPFAPEAFARLRAHPDFRATVQSHARANLAHYGGLPLMGRWLISDMGRSALTGAALVLDGLPGGLTSAGLYQAAAVNRSCSRGRVSAYLLRCAGNGLIVPAADAPPGADTPLTLTPAFLDQLTRSTMVNLGSVTRLAPEIAPAAARLVETDFRRRLFAWLGILTAARPDLFAGPPRPMDLFLDRDGGVRMLERLIDTQPPGRARMLEAVPLSRADLARASFVSRTHVARLLADGEARGLLEVTDRHVAFAPELSEDVERHFALVFEALRAAVQAALDG